MAQNKVVFVEINYKTQSIKVSRQDTAHNYSLYVPTHTYKLTIDRVGKITKISRKYIVIP